jgi:hypothetical protein
MISTANARLLLPLALVLPAGSAGAETLAGAVASLNGGYDSNPLLGSGGAGSGSSAALATATFAPVLRLLAPTNSVEFRGSVDHTTYSHRYSDITNWQLNSAFDQILSGGSKFGVKALASSRKTLGGATVQPTDPGETPDPGAVEDLGRRVRNYSGAASFSTTFSPRDSLSLGANVSAARYDQNGVQVASDSDSFGANFAFSHAVSETLSLRAGGAYSHQSYSSSLFGSSSVIQPFAGVELRMSGGISLSADAGVSFSSSDTATGTSHRQSFYGSANICRDGPRSSLCANGSRTVSANAYRGTSTTTSLRLRYSYALTPLSSIAATGSYSETASVAGLSIGSDKYSSYTFAGDYRRQITRRLSGVASARYLDRTNSLGRHGSGIMGSLGLSYQLGR